MIMKKLLAAVTVAACFALAAFAQEQQQKEHKHDDKAQKHDKHEDKDKHDKAKSAPPKEAENVTLADGETLKRGAAISDSAVAVKLADVLSEPQKYAGKPILVEGVVERVCQMQGCWMELAPEKGARGVRVSFGDHAFFVPFNSAGLKARAEGTFAVKVLSKKEVEHLESDGAKIERKADGTANEVSFVATGVELRK